MPVPRSRGIAVPLSNFCGSRKTAAFFRVPGDFRSVQKMQIIMASLEHSIAPIDLRERLSFTKAQNSQVVTAIREFPGISGCVLLSTCNRTELYLSCDRQEEPGRILCQVAGCEYGPYRQAFVTEQGDDAIRHLMAVAAGLRSRIWGEDQIISQVKNAITLAREAGAADPLLETLFRCAISAGKEVRSSAHLTALPTSAAGMAVELLKKELGSLQGKTAVVIGNGEMGRLAAGLLYSAGARTSVTLRTYRHGETIVPSGCGVIPYEERTEHMEGADLLISATTSPHYTVTARMLQDLKNPPRTLVDLAIPRDIEPECGKIPGIRLFNVDDLGSHLENRTVPPQVQAIIDSQMENFFHWVNFRDCMRSLGSLKDALCQRVLTSRELEGTLSEGEIVQLSVEKTVDLLVSGLAERITADQLKKCESKIRLHTTGKPVI